MSKSEEKRREQSDRIAESIKEQERRREEIKFQEEWSKRIDIAREGRVSYESADAVTAVSNYKKILSLTARRYNVPVEELHPKLFDQKIRVSEGLLISAICFDLAKIVERLEGDTAVKDLRTYLRLFITFSKGMPYEVVATSTIRKYIQYTHGIKHRAQFEAAYKELRKGACFVATAAFGSQDAWQVRDLRRYRDQVLWRTHSGRRWIALYYLLGPQAAQILVRIPGFAPLARRIITWFAIRLRTAKLT